MDRVLVLMSVYNGSRYIKEQLDSILIQESVVADILVRDDGSIDDTVSIVRQYIDKYLSRITLIEGGNIGSTASFSSLLTHALTIPAYDYYAFADQDDVWLPHKIFSAVTMLSKYNTSHLPLGYCSNATLVDENLTTLRQMHTRQPTYTKQSALLQNIATGCTMVFNHEAVCLYVHHMPVHVKMHDHQMFLICLYMGRFVYDSNSYIQYRQHGSNQVGDKTFTARFIRRLKHLGESNDYYYSLSCDFLDSYKHLLDSEDIKKIQVITNYKRSFTDKLSLLFNRNYRYDSLEFNFTLFLKILLGKL